MLTAQSCECAGIIACFCCFDLPQFRGPRLAAVACLLWIFGTAGLANTYFLSFAFSVRWRILYTSGSSRTLCMPNKAFAPAGDPSIDKLWSLQLFVTCALSCFCPAVAVTLQHMCLQLGRV